MAQCPVPTPSPTPSPNNAMFTHVDVCEQVLEKQREYILYTKDNQKQLQEDIELMFTSAERGDVSPSRASCMGA
jgi:hypothetical protein